MQKNYDVIVIGAGHAGTEAAFAAANLGSKVLLLATSLNCVAMMPCNPSVGGPGKGHLVREIHALGGQMGEFVDETYLQIRELNESRGPAVRALRAQSDKKLYHLHVKDKLEKHPKIHLLQGEAVGLLHNNRKITGVEIVTGLKFFAPSVILATGTFLNGVIILGHTRNPGGPSGNASARELTRSLLNLGILVHRLQTATPPRVAGNTIRFENLKAMPGDTHIRTFTGRRARSDQRSCYLTYTNDQTIEAVKANLQNSPLKIGNITQHGPKHCPSIDRKVINFPLLSRHQVFIEPESNYHDEHYLLGLTTSMPPEAQEAVVKSVAGLEQARIVRYGYAIEYDSVQATQLKKSLEFKMVEGLFACGQINGTSGYEEAAAQGLIAGINAHCRAFGKHPFVLKSTSSYLAELIDELVTNDRTEPLRVTTSSSAFRLHLRSDNAEDRLIRAGYELGLVPKARYEYYQSQADLMEEEVCRLKATLIKPSRDNLDKLIALGSAPIKNPTSLANLLSREELRYRDLVQFGHACLEDLLFVERLEIRLKYQIFLDKLKTKMSFVDELDAMIFENSPRFDTVPGLRSEIVQRLNTLQPYSLGQISKVDGITNTEVALLIHAFKQGEIRGSV